MQNRWLSRSKQTGAGRSSLHLYNGGAVFEHCTGSGVPFLIISASLAIRIAEQSAYVTDHVVPRLSVRTYVLWRNG